MKKLRKNNHIRFIYFSHNNLLMNTVSRTITGIIAIALGIFLTIVGIFTPFVLIYGIPILIIGFFILFNKKEDKIEGIKHDTNNHRKRNSRKKNN